MELTSKCIECNKLSKVAIEGQSHCIDCGAVALSMAKSGGSQPIDLFSAPGKFFFRAPAKTKWLRSVPHYKDSSNYLFYPVIAFRLESSRLSLNKAVAAGEGVFLFPVRVRGKGSYGTVVQSRWKMARFGRQRRTRLRIMEIHPAEVDYLGPPDGTPGAEP